MLGTDAQGDLAFQPTTRSFNGSTNEIGESLPDSQNTREGRLSYEYAGVYYEATMMPDPTFGGRIQVVASCTEIPGR